MGKDVFDVKGKIVCITGGLGQLGRQFAGELLRRHARVAILDLPESPGDRLSSFEATTENFIYLSADITNKTSLERALSSVKSKWGAPEALLNNAALDSPPGASTEENGPFENYPEDAWDRVMDVNVKGVFLTCQVFGAAMAAAGKGAIVNICSTYGLVSPDQNIYRYRRERGENFYKPVSYSASKSALLNFTRYLATYFAPKGVRVNTISPGGIFNNQDQLFLKAYCKRVPLGRMADESEYNGAIVFLISDASSYMTGGNLVIDGGWTAW